MAMFVEGIMKKQNIDYTLWREKSKGSYNNVCIIISYDNSFVEETRKTKSVIRWMKLNRTPRRRRRRQ